MGAGLAYALGFPAPFLTGPAAVVAVASLMGAETDIPDRLRDICFVVIGIVLGSSITPELLSAARAWPVSLLAMCAGVGLAMIAGGWMFQRWFGMDRRTALLSASPGHLSFVLSFGTEIGANVGLVAIVQSLRILILTLAVPVAVAVLTDADMSMTEVAGPRLSYPHLALVISGGGLTGLLFKRFNVPAAFLLGAMAFSAAGHGTGLTPGIVPPVLSTAAFVIMGTLIGTRFSGVTLADLKGAAMAGILLTLLALCISVAFAGLVATLTGLPLVDAIIAFAPGGLETMVAMGAILDADPAYVAMHHIARLVFLSFFVPAMLAIGPRGAED